ncbi:hypothetical protein D3C74_322420 [compost metagenome]
MPVIDFPNGGDRFLIKGRQPSNEVILVFSLHQPWPNRLVQQVVTTYDPAIAVPSGELLPQLDPFVPTVFIGE